MTIAYATRPIQEDDRDLLFRIYASVREHERSMLSCTDEQWTTFLSQQFEAQTSEYRRNNPDADFSIVLVKNDVAGRLYVRHDEDRMHLIDIALLPEFRGKGLGSTILADLQAQAAEYARDLTIYVEENNPAMRLYLRLGFVETDSLGLYRLMRWSPRK